MLVPREAVVYHNLQHGAVVPLAEGRSTGGFVFFVNIFVFVLAYSLCANGTQHTDHEEVRSNRVQTFFL